MPLKKNWLQFIGLSGLVCLLSGLVLFNRIAETDFHSDESGWISSGNYYSALLLKGDFRHENWRCRQCGGWGSLNMHLGKWLIGIPLKLYSQGRTQDSASEFFNYYDTTLSLYENIERGKVPPDDILLLARSFSALFGALSCLVIFAIGYLSHDTWTGLTALVLLLTNPLFTQCVTRAMTDVHYNFFLLCLALSTILILKVYKKTRIALGSSLCGILAGFAGSVKVTGIVIGYCLFLAVVIYKHMICKPERQVMAFSVTFFFVSSLFVIYVLNPYFWPSLNVINGREIIYELQSLPKVLRIAKLKTGSDLRERYPQMSNLSHVLEFPYVFRRWQAVMEDQKRIKSASWEGSRFQSFHQRLLVRYSSFPLEWIFLVIGIALYPIWSSTSWNNKEITYSVIPLLYFLINYAFILTFMEVNWSRYYLPTIIASKLVIAAGICEVISRAYRYSGPQKKYSTRREVQQKAISRS